MLTLRQIARLAGVSPPTVSRVFSGHVTVSGKTRTRVLAVAEAHGFRPSAIGRVNFGGGTHSIGVLLPTLGVSYFSDIATGVQQELLGKDYLPMVLQTECGDPDRRAIQRLLDHCVDGMILFPVDETLDQNDFSRIVKMRLPLVLLGAAHPVLPFDTVTDDDREGGRQAGRHLLDLGHRHMAFCGFGAGHSSSDLRLGGFREVLGEAGFSVPADNTVMLHPTASDRTVRLQADLRRLLNGSDRPTAVFAATDSLAGEVYRVAREQRLSIPGDLSVMGFANLAFAPLADPPLTSIDQSGTEVGRRAGRIILSRLENPDMPLQNVVIPTRLIERASTARTSV